MKFILPKIVLLIFGKSIAYDFHKAPSKNPTPAAIAKVAIG